MPKISEEEKLKRLANFYDNEIEKNKKALFSRSSVREIKKTESRIKYFEERRDELRAIASAV